MSTAGGYTATFHVTRSPGATGRQYLVHTAGKFDGKVQACRRCGGHLIYYGNILYRGPDAPEAWPVGAQVGVSISGRPTRSYLVEDRELDPDEELCRARHEEG